MNFAFFFVEVCFGCSVDLSMENDEFFKIDFKTDYRINLTSKFNVT